MPIQVEGPDGQLLEFPDGTDRETMRAAMRRRYPPNFSGVTSRAESFPTPQALASTMAPQVDYMPGMGAIDSGAPAFDPAAAEAASMANRRADFAGLPAPLRGAIGAGSRVNAMARGVGQVLGVRSESDETAARAADQFMDGDTAASVGQIAGDIGMMAAPLSRLAPAGAATRYGLQTAVGAGYGALQPIASGESRLLNTGVGGILGASGQGLSDAVAFAGRRAGAAIAPQLRELYQSAKARGITLTPAQLSDSRALKFLESGLRSLPFNGLGAKSAAQRTQFNRAAANAIGEDASAVTPEVFSAAKSRIGKQFNTLSERNSLPVDDALLAKLINIQQEASSMGDEATGKAVNSAISRIMD